MQSTDAAVEAVEFGEIPGQIVGEKFGQILSNRLPSLYRGAYRILGNSADAEDAVQDALLAAYTHLEPIQGTSKDVHLAGGHRAQFGADAVAEAAAPHRCSSP